MTARRHLSMSEADWQRQVIDLAHLYGWRVAHFRAAKTDRGWRTPVQADGAGFPDLTLVRGTALLFAELKVQRGRVSASQQAWLDALRAVEASVLEARSRIARIACGHGGTALELPTNSAPCVEVHVWRPSDFDEMQARLARGRTRIRPEYAVPLPSPPEAA